MSTGFLRYDIVRIMKQGGTSLLQIEGALQLPKSGADLTDNASTPTIGQSIVLGTISADKNLDFVDLDADREGTLMLVRNKNNSGFGWTATGNVVESTTLDPIALIETGVHLFVWEGTYWSRVSGGDTGGGGGGTDVVEGAFDTP